MVFDFYPEFLFLAIAAVAVLFLIAGALIFWHLSSLPASTEDQPTKDRGSTAKQPNEKPLDYDY